MGVFGGIMVFVGIATGLVALVAALRRAPRSRFRGVVSVSCLAIGVLSLMIASSQGPDANDVFLFFLYATPGLLAIMFAPRPRLQPGHCTTCGDNLTGNVSGKCSECGAPVVAP